MGPESAVTHSKKTVDPVQKPRARGRRTVRSYHIAALVFVVAVGTLLIYAFYPVLTGSTDDDERPTVDAADTAPARVGSVVVTARDLVLRAEATGYLAPWRVADVSAEGSGRVVERLVEEGRFVSEGDVILRLDDRDQLIELSEAEAAHLDARAVYAVNTSRGVESVVDTARVAAARERLIEVEDAFARGEASQDDVMAERRRFESALVLSGSERAAVQAVTSGLVQAEQRLERARLALSRRTVTAPFAGRIADLQVEAGQHVGAGQTAVSIIDDSRMKVEVDVLESDLVGVRVGGTALVRVPSHDDAVFQGVVHSINPRIDTRTGTGRVTVVVSNPQRRLMSGLFAYVALETGRLGDRLVVPAEAVLVRQGRDLVFRLSNGRAEWVYVTVGRRSGDEVEILDGIREGDSIAVSGHYALAHDAPVAAE